MKKLHSQTDGSLYPTPTICILTLAKWKSSIARPQADAGKPQVRHTHASELSRFLDYPRLHASRAHFILEASNYKPQLQTRVPSCRYRGNSNASIVSFQKAGVSRVCTPQLQLLVVCYLCTFIIWWDTSRASSERS